MPRNACLVDATGVDTAGISLQLEIYAVCLKFMTRRGGMGGWVDQWVRVRVCDPSSTRAIPVWCVCAHLRGLALLFWGYPFLDMGSESVCMSLSLCVYLLLL